VAERSKGEDIVAESVAEAEHNAVRVAVAVMRSLLEGD